LNFLNSAWPLYKVGLTEEQVEKEKPNCTIVQSANVLRIWKYSFFRYSYA